MQFTDLLRLTVLLVAAAATALAVVAVVSAQVAEETVTLIVAAAWWTLAAVYGMVSGRAERAADGVAAVLSAARTSTSLPDVSPNRIAVARLWPIAVFALVAGGLALLFPAVPAVGAGYALLVALQWRNREAAVTAVEDRDGVCFYVEPSSALEPVRLVRTPGLGRDRATRPKPPPPPPVGGR